MAPVYRDPHVQSTHTPSSEDNKNNQASATDRVHSAAARAPPAQASESLPEATPPRRAELAVQTRPLRSGALAWGVSGLGALRATLSPPRGGRGSWGQVV